MVQGANDYVTMHFDLQVNDNRFRGSVWTAIYKLMERSMIDENFRDVR